MLFDLRDTLTYERPSMDIFKAIFASDEESDGEGQEDNEEDDIPIPVSVPTPAPVSSAPVVDPPQASYQPSLNGHTATSPEKFDIGSFKPTFIPRDGKSKKGKDKPNKEKKKTGKVLVSFELDEDSEEPSAPKVRSKDKDKDRPKKKRKEKKNGGGGLDEGDGMWVEKPPPEVVKDMAVPSDLTGDVVDTEPSLNRGRKRAIDFM